MERSRSYSGCVVVIVPSMTSAWPPMYFVAAMIETSTPSCMPGKKYGVAQRVVHHDHDPARVRDRGDRGNVLHLERQRPRRLDEHHPRLRPHQLGDAGADARVVERRLDAEPRQNRVAEVTRRPVRSVDHQEMVAALAAAPAAPSSPRQAPTAAASRGTRPRASRSLPRARTSSACRAARSE